jgi:hypothetical protein
MPGARVLHARVTSRSLGQAGLASGVFFDQYVSPALFKACSDQVHHSERHPLALVQHTPHHHRQLHHSTQVQYQDPEYYSLFYQNSNSPAAPTIRHGGLSLLISSSHARHLALQHLLPCSPVSSSSRLLHNFPALLIHFSILLSENKYYFSLSTKSTK